MPYAPIVRQLGAQQLVNHACIWQGWSLVEWSGVADADMEFWDGNPSAGGTYICTIRVSGAESDTIPVPNVRITNSLWCNNTTGVPGGGFIGSAIYK